MSDYDNNNPYAFTNVEDDGYTVPSQHVPDYLVWAILETLFCCPALGIVGIVYSVQANSAKSVGNFSKAQEDAAKAKKWLFIGLIGYVALIAIYIIIAVVAAVSGNNGGGGF
ncbi:MAG: CD225/dispanin family protein [Planctomycetaceae bacterium]|nr:CD225/dispanin family protein [Planctomycetaceae bacterium]